MTLVMYYVHDMVIYEQLNMCLLTGYGIILDIYSGYLVKQSACTRLDMAYLQKSSFWIRCVFTFCKSCSFVKSRKMSLELR